MSDSQLTQTINQLSHPAKRSVSGLCYSNAAMHRCYLAKSSNLVPTPVATSVAPTPVTVSHTQPLAYQPPSPPPTIAAPQTALPIDPRSARPRAPLLTTQALQSTYASRLQAGACSSRGPFSPARQPRGGIVSYGDPGSGDDIPDAREVDSGGSDFVTSGGTRTAIRAVRVANGAIAYAVGGTPAAKPFSLTKRVDFSEKLAEQAQRSIVLVPICVEFETDAHRIRDCFVWNLHESLVTPEQFARTFCADLDLPPAPWADTVAAQIRAQLDDQDGVGSMELAVDGGEPLIAHAVHEELMKHKKDAIEWGVIGGFPMEQAASAEDGSKDKSALGVMKDKTGLGLGWGRTPKEGRGPRILRSVWRDWAEAEEFKTRWEMLSQEEVERREIERERASRVGQLRRETSKFQSSTRTKGI
ncbi:SNF5-domain-containing protein [Lactarius indigo]|nr:SNF5-domain-containing protein [Lactarius indigo]